jgi:hypothetical protein
MTRGVACGAYLSGAPPRSAPTALPAAPLNAPPAAPPHASAYPPPPPSPPPPLWSGPPPPAWAVPPPPIYSGYSPHPQVVKARRDTKTGLMLILIGLGLDWIPYIKDVAGLISLVGILFLFVGRWGFTKRHHDYVVAGGVLLLISFIAAIAIGAALALAIFQAASQMGSTPQTLASSIDSTIQDTIIAGVIVAVLTSVAQLLMVWEIADSTARWLLILGLGASFVVGIVIAAIELPLLATAVQTATSGSMVNAGPINNLENQINVYGLLTVFPSAISAYAYYRIWGSIDENSAAPLRAGAFP